VKPPSVKKTASHAGVWCKVGTAFVGTYLAASLFAAISPDAKPAGYSGSSQKIGFRCPVKEAKPHKEAVIEHAAKQLSDKLAQLSDVLYGV